MKNITLKHILDIQPYVPGKPIEEVQRQLGLKKVYKMASNENPFGPSPKALCSMRRSLKDLNRYPDANCFYLRQEIAKRLKVQANQLIFGNGSDEIIVLATRAFIQKGDEVVIAHPTFLIYDIASRINAARVVKVPLRNFRYDLSAMLSAITSKTKIIFIANPDNPTGTYVTKKEVENFVKAVPSDILIFLDEAYYEYAPKKDYPDSFSLMQRHKNVLFTRTFSKFYALAGLRIGYGVGDHSLIDILNRIREPFNVNSIAQEAALAALSDKKYYQSIFRKNEKEKKRLYEKLKKMGVFYVPSATNFILIDIKQKGSQVFQRLLQKGVIVRDMTGWGFDTFIRVTVGDRHQNDAFIKHLKEIL